MESITKKDFIDKLSNGENQLVFTRMSMDGARYSNLLSEIESIGNFELDRPRTCTGKRATKLLFSDGSALYTNDIGTCYKIGNALLTVKERFDDFDGVKLYHVMVYAIK